MRPHSATLYEPRVSSRTLARFPLSEWRLLVHGRLLRAAAILAVLCGATVAFGNSTGPIASRTGAFAVAGRPGELNCSECHTKSAQGIPSGINDASGSLKLFDIPASYTPGATYPLRVHLEHAWNPLPLDPIRWGFELQSVAAATGDSVGSWVLGANTPPDTFRIVLGVSSSVFRGRRYIEHTRNAFTDVGANHVGEPGPIEWHGTWRAPATDVGKIYFFSAGNSANGDLTSLGSGDYIFTTVDSTVAGPVLAVPPGGPLALEDALDPPTPNPTTPSAHPTLTVAPPPALDPAGFY